MSETSREEIAKLCDALPCGWKTQTCDVSPKLSPCLKCRARRAILSQQRSLDRVAALCDEASPARVEIETMEERGGRVVTVLNILQFKAVSEAKLRAAVEAQPSPEPETARKGKTP
jgi:hypothetical protein